MGIQSKNLYPFFPGTLTRGYSLNKSLLTPREETCSRQQGAVSLCSGDLRVALLFWKATCPLQLNILQPEFFFSSAFCISSFRVQNAPRSCTLFVPSRGLPTVMGVFRSVMGTAASIGWLGNFGRRFDTACLSSALPNLCLLPWTSWPAKSFIVQDDEFKVAGHCCLRRVNVSYMAYWKNAQDTAFLFFLSGSQCFGTSSGLCGKQCTYSSQLVKSCKVQQYRLICCAFNVFDKSCANA